MATPDLDDSPTARAIAQHALAIVNAYMSANQDWKVARQPNGDLAWGFPGGGPPPPPQPIIATIPNPALQSQAFSVSWAPYVTGTFISASLQLVSGSITGWSLGGANQVTVTFAPGGGAQSGVVKLVLVWSGGTVVSNNVTLASSVPVSADTFAPTTPTEFFATLDPLNRPQLTWDAQADPAPPGQQWSGLQGYPVTKGGAALTTKAAPGRGVQFAMSAADIGAPAIAGSTAQTGASLNMSAGGLDFYGTADQGQFSGAQITGDFVLTGQVTSGNWPNQYSKIGLDCRLNLTAGSPHVAAFACRPADGGVQMNARTTQGGLTTPLGPTGVAYSLPMYLRLTRVGNVFTMLTSPTGVTFTQTAQITVALASQCYVGFASSAHDATSTMISTIAQTALTQDPQQTYTDNSVVQGTNPQTLVYAVTSKDVATNTSIAAPSVTIVVPGTGGGGGGGGTAGIRIAGNKFALNGSVIQLQGSNISGLETGIANRWPAFANTSDATWQAIKANWRLNALRWPLNERSWLSAANYDSIVVQGVTNTTRNGIIQIVEIHWACPNNVNGAVPKGQPGFPNTDNSLTFISQVAAAFKNNNMVVIELFNEPFANDDYNYATSAAGLALMKNGGTLNPFKMQDNSQQNNPMQTYPVNYGVAGLQQLLDAVRAAGFTGPVLYPQPWWSGEIEFSAQVRPTDSLGQLGAAMHAYAYAKGTGNLTNVLNAGIPIWITEYYHVNNIGGYPFLQSNKVAYTMWGWNDWGGQQNFDFLKTLSPASPGGSDMY